MFTPLLNIIIPCKDDFGFANACLSSILQQSFTDWKCIIIFDEAPTKTIAEIEEITQNDNRFTLINNTGKGIVDALNSAFNQCNAKYISRFDIDDIMPPNRLQKMVDYLEKNTSIDLVTGKVKYFSNQPISLGYQKYESWLNQTIATEKIYKNIYRECSIASPNWMIRTQKLITSGGFKKLSYPEDYDLLFRWYKHGIKIGVINDITLYWREHQQRTSRNHIHYQQKAFFELKIQRWLELDFSDQKEILLLGKNIKAKLTAQILTKNNIPFKWFVENDSTLTQTQDNQRFYKISAIKNHLPAQILIAFWLDNNDFEKYLNQLLGENQFYIL